MEGFIRGLVLEFCVVQLLRFSAGDGLCPAHRRRGEPKVPAGAAPVPGVWGGGAGHLSPAGWGAGAALGVISAGGPDGHGGGVRLGGPVSAGAGGAVLGLCRSARKHKGTGVSALLPGLGGAGHGACLWGGAGDGADLRGYPRHRHGLGRRGGGVGPAVIRGAFTAHRGPGLSRLAV